MCEPTTLSMIGMAMTAYSSYAQGQSAQAQGRYNARVSENNAQRARSRGTDRENQLRLQTQQLRKEQEAQFGAKNVQLGTGSASDILADTEKFGEVDALNVRSSTDVEVENYMASAEASQMQGDNTASAGTMGAFSSLISGAGKVADKWYPTAKSTPKFGVGLASNPYMAAL